MSVQQFKRQASAIHLPDYNYAKYEDVVRQCQACEETKPPPQRSKVSGLRATNFGDLLFIDHCFPKIKDKDYVVFIILDGASQLLSASVTPSKDDEDAQACVLEWMDNYQCWPQTIVGDMAFMGEHWQRFYNHRGIKPIALGPRTPWPNRAETAVRLFKRQLTILVQDALADPTLKQIKGITAQQMVRKCVWARNTQLTFSGKTPIEIAFGRRPPDLIMTENADPGQLSEPPNLDQQRNDVLQRLALKAHIEAQQPQDLRRDIASRLRPSEGPFSAGERVF